MQAGEEVSRRLQPERVTELLRQVVGELQATRHSRRTWRERRARSNGSLQQALPVVPVLVLVP